MMRRKNMSFRNMIRNVLLKAMPNIMCRCPPSLFPIPRLGKVIGETKGMVVLLNIRCPPTPVICISWRLYCVMDVIVCSTPTHCNKNKDDYTPCIALRAACDGNLSGSLQEPAASQKGQILLSVRYHLSTNVGGMPKSWRRFLALARCWD